MNVLYLSLSYLPSRRASSVHVMRMCSALARAGHDVRLVAKANRDDAAAGLSDHAFYGIAEPFAIDKLARPKRRGGGVIYAAAMIATLARARADLVYSRDIVGALAAAEMGMATVFEAHDVPSSKVVRAMLRRLIAKRSLRGLVVITHALGRDLADAGLVPPRAPVIVAADGADLPPKREPARRGPPRVGYVGNLYRGRGVELVVDVAARMPDVTFELVGGNERDLAMWRARAVTPNVVFRGFLPPAQLADCYRTFDVLVMPYQRHGVGVATGNDTSRWASPMKMFEYMASGVPIVSSDLPVLGEVIADNVHALIAPADDASAWIAAIRRLLDDRALGQRLATQAYDTLAREYTWDARVARIFRQLYGDA